jgi:predicted deacylase
MIKVYSYHSLSEGPHLLVLGSVHGDEICGPPAIQEMIEAFENGTVKPEKGGVTFIPICNPKAHEERKRFIDVNLNRNFSVRKEPQRYEEFLMNKLAPYLKECDVLLDIHSYAAGGPAFAFRGPDSKMRREEKLASYLGVDFTIYGWHEAYMNSGIELDAAQSVGLTEFVRQSGGISITIECGQHNDPKSVEAAGRGIRGALHFCGIVPRSDIKPNKDMRFTRLQMVYFKTQAGRFLQPWTHLQKVKKNEKLAQMEDGTIISAPFEGRIIFPKEKAAIDEEWLYLSIDEAGSGRGAITSAIKRKLAALWRLFVDFVERMIQKIRGR